MRPDYFDEHNFSARTESCFEPDRNGMPEHNYVDAFYRGRILIQYQDSGFHYAVYHHEPIGFAQKQKAEMNSGV
jgi:hypothetical protein